jgi:hypothetical protein
VSSLAERALHAARTRVLTGRPESGEAVIEYRDANIRVVKAGRFVRCAVTGEAIPLDQLKYWSVERQEAYASPEAVLRRLERPLPKGPG